MVELHQNERFYELRLDQRSLDYHYRLMREYRITFRYRPHVALEFEVSQELQELLAEASLASQIVRVFFGKAETLHISDDLFKTCHDGKSAAVRNAPEEYVKTGFRVPYV